MDLPIEAMLTVAQTSKLLDDLCVHLGSCLAPDDRRQLVVDPPADVPEFTDRVFVAEGLDPETADRRLRRQVRAMIQAAFDRCDDHGD